MPKPDQTLDDILNPIAKGLTGTAPEPVPEPAPEPDPKIILDHIAEVSKTARATGFGLLGLLVFVGITLLAHKDADFFAFGVETQLPLINVEIPVKAFFVFAPALVAALYIYLHLYLMTLWDDLADAPEKIDGQPLADRVFTWAVSYAALWYRNRSRRDGCAAPRVLGWMVVAVSILAGPVFGVAVLALFWWHSMPAHDEWLTLWIGLNFWLAALIGQTGFLTARARMAGVTREKVVRARWGYRLFGAIAFVILACLSWLRTEGGFENYADWIERSGNSIGSPQAATWLNANLPTTEDIANRTDLRWFRLYPANLVEADLTRKPPGWLPFEFWLKEFEPDYRDRNGAGPDTDLTTDRAFIIEATRRYKAPLGTPNLKGADLRNANMLRAFLPGADLREARMQGADLRHARMQGAFFDQAEMQGADLREAKMQGAGFSWAHMQGVNLNRAKMQSANFNRAQMQGANLSGAQMQGTDLHDANLQGVDLRGALMPGANLYRVEMQGSRFFRAKMQGVNLRQAEMQGATLQEAQMQGADLTRAKMKGADFSRANMQGAVLSHAKMRNADCRGVALEGVLLQSTDANCNNLTQAQLALAVGDARTVLPRGLTVATCLETLPDDVEAALAHHPEEEVRFGRISRAKVRDALLCDPGETPRATDKRR
jgi:uncharacterized protein YjbI with pentapeptide repeats